MSWDCPNLFENKCDLNNTTCIPAKGKCVLKGTFITAENLIELNKIKQKIDTNHQDKNHNGGEIKCS